MKNKIIIFLLILNCLLLSGCTIGNSEPKVLSCSKPYHQNKLNYTETQEITFKGKKITTYRLIFKYDLTSYAYNTTIFNQLIDGIKLELSGAVESGVQVDVYPEGNYAMAIIKIDSESFDGYLDYTKTDFNKMFKSQISWKSLKAEIEKANYVCK